MMSLIETLSYPFSRNSLAAERTIPSRFTSERLRPRDLLSFGGIACVPDTSVKAMTLTYAKDFGPRPAERCGDGRTHLDEAHRGCLCDGMQPHVSLPFRPQRS